MIKEKTKFKVNEKVYIYESDGLTQDVIIPNKILGIDVIGIEEDVFKGKDLKRIVLPSSMKILKSRQFMDCTNLEQIVFPKNCKIKEIPEYCFYNAFSENSSAIIIPNKVKIIEQFAFRNTRRLILGILMPRYRRLLTFIRICCILYV